MGRTFGPFTREGREVPRIAYIAGRGSVHFLASYVEFIYVPWVESSETWTRQSDALNLQTGRTALRDHQGLSNSMLSS